jgi:hypothetical protein
MFSISRQEIKITLRTYWNGYDEKIVVLTPNGEEGTSHTRGWV